MDEQNPYRSPDAVVAEISEGELAERGTRLGAALIDGIIMIVMVLPLMYFGGYWTTAMAAATAGERVGFGTTLMWALIGFAAFALVQFVPLNDTGQTWGKKLLGIKIVDMAGSKPPVLRLLGLRYMPWHIGSNLPFIGWLLGLVNILLIFRGDRRCGHDLIAGTQVVKAR